MNQIFKKSALILIITLILGLSQTAFAQHSGDDDDSSCDRSRTERAQICCNSGGDFVSSGSGSSPLIACTKSGTGCRSFTDACGSPHPGERCQTVWLDDCGDCSFGEDFLFCPLPAATACGSGPARASELVSSPAIGLGGRFGTSAGVCVIDPKAAFIPFKIPTYQELKSIYHTQAKPKTGITLHPTQTGDKTQADIPLTAGSDHVYHINGKLTISLNTFVNQTGIIFVDGNLLIGPIPENKLTHGTNTSGLVFVVGGDVMIDTSITQLNAVIISQGVICTASSSGSCPEGQASALSPSGRLIVVGSLINLDPSKPVRFRRTLTDNNAAAEVILAQPKYLAILRDIFSDTLQKWTELP